MNNLIIFLFILIFLTACSVGLKNNDINHENQVLIEEFIINQKKKLPINVNEKTNWVDVYNINNKLVYVYKVNMVSVDTNIIDRMKYVNNTSPKIEEICGPILDVFDGTIDVEYKFVNINNLYLFSINFNKEKCEKHFNSH